MNGWSPQEWGRPGSGCGSWLGPGDLQGSGGDKGRAWGAEATYPDHLGAGVVGRSGGKRGSQARGSGPAVYPGCPTPPGLRAAPGPQQWRHLEPRSACSNAPLGGPQAHEEAQGALMPTSPQPNPYCVLLGDTEAREPADPATFKAVCCHPGPGKGHGAECAQQEDGHAEALASRQPPGPD